MATWQSYHVRGISIHALLAESDPGKVSSVLPGFAFLSTLSLRRATFSRRLSGCCRTYFYPRSPCGERRPWGSFWWGVFSISIHALLAESDETVQNYKYYYHISIHALLAESDNTCRLYSAVIVEFLSTLSLRRATISKTDRSTTIPFLSTLSLRRATLRL